MNNAARWLEYVQLKESMASLADAVRAGDWEKEMMSILEAQAHLESARQCLVKKHIIQ